MPFCDYCNDSELVDGQPCPSCSAELDIDGIDAELEQLYAAEHANIPYVDDRIRHQIYYLKDLRKELEAVEGLHPQAQEELTKLARLAEQSKDGTLRIFRRR